MERTVVPRHLSCRATQSLVAADKAMVNETVMPISHVVIFIFLFFGWGKLARNLVPFKSPGCRAVSVNCPHGQPEGRLSQAHFPVKRGLC